MLNYVHNIPTKLYFGKGQIDNLPTILKEYGKNVLMVYGGGSIKKIGLYDSIINLLNQNECDNHLILFLYSYQAKYNLYIYHVHPS